MKKDVKGELSSSPPKITKEESKRSIFANKATVDLKQLKIVTHKPKEEKDTFNNDSSPKKQKKSEKPSTLEKQNEAQHFSEASDVENITAISKLFKFSINIDTLKEVLEEMRIQIDQNTTSIHNVKNEVALKAGESNLGRYLERIASGVHKDVGDPEHIFKLNEPGFLESNFKTPDGDKLKKGVEKVIAKMEVISNFAKQQKKFKTSANNRIHALEEEQK